MLPRIGTAAAPVNSPADRRIAPQSTGSRRPIHHPHPLPRSSEALRPTRGLQQPLHPAGIGPCRRTGPPPSVHCGRSPRASQPLATHDRSPALATTPGNSAPQGRSFHPCPGLVSFPYLSTCTWFRFMHWRHNPPIQAPDRLYWFMRGCLQPPRPPCRRLGRRGGHVRGALGAAGGDSGPESGNPGL